MHEATTSARAPEAIALLLLHGYRLDVTDEDGHTPLQYAALYGRGSFTAISAVSFMLEHCPEAVGCRDNLGRGLMDLAKSSYSYRKDAHSGLVTWLEQTYGSQTVGTPIDRVSMQQIEPNLPLSQWKNDNLIDALYLVIHFLVALMAVCIY